MGGELPERFGGVGGRGVGGDGDAGDRRVAQHHPAGHLGKELVGVVGVELGEDLGFVECAAFDLVGDDADQLDTSLLGGPSF